MATDGMVMREIRVPVSEVSWVKSVLEAYPGLCSVHAPRGRAQGSHTSLVIASSSGAALEVSAIVDELLAEGRA